jgi:hypothetical protein
MERIAHAGIRRTDGSIGIGKSHVDVRETSEKGSCATGRDDQGFVTSEGRFVNRLYATDLAYGAGQLSDEHYNLIGGGELISENLWEYGGYSYTPERGYFKDRDEELEEY